MNKKGHYRKIPIIITDMLDDGMEFQGSTEQELIKIEKNNA